MNKEKIIAIAILIIVIIIIIFGILNSNKNNNSNYQSEEVETLNVEEKENIESNFNEAVSKARDMYKTYGSQNFSVYFDIDFVDNYMKEGSLRIVNNISAIDFEWVDIYDAEGKKLEEFPTTFLDGTEIKYENESYQISPNKNYLLKISSDYSSYTYYYILKYDKTGNATLTDICYTIGESSPVDNDLIDTTLDN
jgi:cell division protein YceG involved in septum cleavage